MDPMVTPYDEIERLLKENAALRGEVAVLKAEMVKRDGEYRERTGEYIRACNEITELKAALSRYREAVEWALNTWNLTEEEGNELIRRAGMEG